MLASRIHIVKVRQGELERWGLLVRGATPPPLAVRAPLGANRPFVGDCTHSGATSTCLAVAAEDFERIRTGAEQLRTRGLTVCMRWPSVGPMPTPAPSDQSAAALPVADAVFDLDPPSPAPGAATSPGVIDCEPAPLGLDRHGREVRDRQHRADDMFERWMDGASLHSLGEAYGVSRERARQILHPLLRLDRHKDARRERAQRIAQRRETAVAHGVARIASEDPQATPQEIADRLPGVHTDQVRRLLGSVESARRTPQRGSRGAGLSEDAVRACLRQVADLNGGRDKPLSLATYDRLRGEGSMSGARLIQHYGTWRQVCRMAAVASNAPLRRSYERRWTEEQALRVLREFVEQADVRCTVSRYQEWARGRDDAPSEGTLRARFGSWTLAVQAAAHLDA